MYTVSKLIQNNFSMANFINWKGNNLKIKVFNEIMINSNKNICIDSKNQKGFVNGMDYKI